MKSPELSVEANKRIDRICDEFEVAWNRTGGRVDIEQWIARAPAVLRSRLFPELVALDSALRALQDETVSSFALSGLSVAESELQPLVKQASVDAMRDSADRLNSSPEVLRRALLCCSTFEGLSEEASDALGRRLKVQQFAPGETLLAEDGQASGLYIVLDGYLEIRKFDQGDNSLIARASRGSLLGEMSMLTGQPCTASVIATNLVTALVLSNEDYFMLRGQYPELEIAISQLVSDRLGSRSQDSLCGRVIGGYRIVRCLNRGGMGVVYEAKRADQPEGPPLALKMLRHRYVYDESAVEHFQREGLLLQRLRHDNIIAVRACFVAFNTRFLAMDYCDGDDLARRLNKCGQLPEEVVRAILGQIALGLKYAHSQGVIHMDLKPSNVLIHRDGQVAIADFGLSRILGSERSWKIVRGTPAYMPPEQLAGLPVGFAGDWYAIGCLAFELLSGNKLFTARDLVELCLAKSCAHPNQDWPKLSISEELLQMLREMLRVDPHERQFAYDRIAAWARPVPELFDGSMRARDR